MSSAKIVFRSSRIIITFHCGIQQQDNEEIETKSSMASRSNWQLLKVKLKNGEKAKTDSKKHPRQDLNKALKKSSGTTQPADELGQKKKKDVILDGTNLSNQMKSKYVGLDCEMVGVGEDGKRSALARCSMVDFDGNTIYDKFVRPKAFVTDFRTQWSGVRKQDLRAGEAITFNECQQDVACLLKSKILVGHALNNDMDVLMLSHPRTMIRDTARFAPYMRSHGRNGGKLKPRALRDLTKQFLRQEIQTGEHDPAEDARSAMFLYRLKMKEWEETVQEAKKQKIAAFCGKKSAAKIHQVTTTSPEEGDTDSAAVSVGADETDTVNAISAVESNNKKKRPLSGTSVARSDNNGHKDSNNNNNNNNGIARKRPRLGSGIGTGGMFAKNAMGSKGTGGARETSIADVDKRMQAGAAAAAKKRKGM